MPESEPPVRQRLPKIWGTQLGLANPAQIDQIKADMRAGRYAYHELRGRLYGLRDAKGVYYVQVGHHRMAAAMEIYKESGDPTPVQELVRWGKWTTVNIRIVGTRPLPARDWWGALRNRLGL